MVSIPSRNFLTQKSIINLKRTNKMHQIINLPSLKIIIIAMILMNILIMLVKELEPNAIDEMVFMEFFAFIADVFDILNLLTTINCDSVAILSFSTNLIWMFKDSLYIKVVNGAHASYFLAHLYQHCHYYSYLKPESNNHVSIIMCIDMRYVYTPPGSNDHS